MKELAEAPYLLKSEMVINRLLKKRYERRPDKENGMKKRSICFIFEHFEEHFSAVPRRPKECLTKFETKPRAIVFQHPVKIRIGE